MTSTNSQQQTQAPLLSQVNVTTINQRCLELFRKLACLENVRTGYTDPLLVWSTQVRQPPVPLSQDPVGLCWSLLRQGGALCHLLNRLRPNTIPVDVIHPLPSSSSSDPASLSPEYFVKNRECRENLMTFLKACREELYMTDDQLFMPSDLYTESTNVLSKAVGIAEKFMQKVYATERFNWGKKAGELVASNQELYGDAGRSDDISSAAKGGESKDTDQTASASRHKRLLVIDELLDTERKYVADLELLHRFADECKMDQILEPEVFYDIFSNIERLLDFQRRFLIKIEGPLSAAQKSLEASYQSHIGALFTSTEPDFAVYDIFCANHKKASEVAGLEAERLKAEQRILDPRTQLPSFLIKPIQRVCKYPLLLRELIARSPPDAPDLDELKQAEAAMKRVGDRVNEKQRKAENTIVEAEFRERLEDWKGLKGESESLGELILFEPKLIVQQGGVEKELAVYLFEKVIVMVKEGKGSLSISMFKKHLAATPLTYKGHIYLNQIQQVGCHLNNTNKSVSVQVTYGDGLSASTTFALAGFKTAETAEMWNKTLQREAKKSGGMVAGSSAAQRADRRKSRMMMRMEQQQQQQKPHVPVSAISSSNLAHQQQQSITELMRVKIEFKGDCYMLLVPELPSLPFLRQSSHQKIAKDYAETGRNLSLSQDSRMRLKYQDGPDQVVLVDEDDLAEAIELHPNELKIIIEELKK